MSTIGEDDVVAAAAVDDLEVRAGGAGAAHSLPPLPRNAGGGAASRGAGGVGRRAQRRDVSRFDGGRYALDAASERGCLTAATDGGVAAAAGGDDAYAPGFASSSRAASAGAGSRRKPRCPSASTHPQLVGVLYLLPKLASVPSTAGGMLIAMELVRGCDLGAALAGAGALYAGGAAAAGARASSLARQLLCGLAHMHARGVMHQDVKPANLLLDAAGKRPRGDYGLAAFATAYDALALRVADLAGNARLDAGRHKGDSTSLQRSTAQRHLGTVLAVSVGSEALAAVDRVAPAAAPGDEGGVAVAAALAQRCLMPPGPRASGRSTLDIDEDDVGYDDGPTEQAMPEYEDESSRLRHRQQSFQDELARTKAKLAEMPRGWETAAARDWDDSFWVGVFLMIFVIGLIIWGSSPRRRGRGYEEYDDLY
ncbi:serine threonine protein kinase [Aureococcus anophagefferens]|nr:serine threonine protein kinase [Aureococcus anophagefferens]